MQKLITTVAGVLVVSLSLLPAPAAAQGEMPAGEHRNGGLGFHTTSAPLGLRWWFAGQKVGLDVGLGFRSSPAPSYSDEKLTGWAVDVGVPIVAKSWSRVHLIVRPGIFYDSQQFQVTSPPADFDTDDQTTFNISGEIEAEVFLADNFSVSASHGIAFESLSPVGGGDSITSFSTIGNNFTNVGFHVYFFGGSQ